MSWTCKECGEELSSDALFLDKYCPNCYTPVFDFDVWEGLDVLQTIVIKWQFNMLGGFFSALMLLIAKADDFNKERLRRGFPDHVKAYELFTNEPGWWDATLALAKKLKYIKENRT